MLFQSELLTHRTPAVFVVNEKKYYNALPFAFKGPPQNTVLFFGVIQKHLRLQKPLLNDHLKGLTYSQIIAKDFDMIPLSTFIY